MTRLRALLARPGLVRGLRLSFVPPSALLLYQTFIKAHRVDGIDLTGYLALGLSARPGRKPVPDGRSVPVRLPAVPGTGADSADLGAL